MEFSMSNPIGFELPKQKLRKVFNISFEFPIGTGGLTKADYEVYFWSSSPEQEMISVESDELNIEIVRETIDEKGFFDFGPLRISGMLKRTSNGEAYLLMDERYMLPASEETRVFLNILRWCSPNYEDPLNLRYSCSMRYK